MRERVGHTKRKKFEQKNRLIDKRSTERRKGGK